MKRNSGFTLLELIVVLIIIGILGTFGFVQYTRTIEKGRAAEAKSILGTLRTLEATYNQEQGTYANVATLGVGIPDTACNTGYFFMYQCAVATGTCTATRCTSGGKTPNYTSVYTITLDQSGAWGGTVGYY